MNLPSLIYKLIEIGVYLLIGKKNLSLLLIEEVYLLIEVYKLIENKRTYFLENK